jgi:tRNA U34 5-methylaminomethyl-2-thiouridine-forming methyltransferase MnmC
MINWLPNNRIIQVTGDGSKTIFNSELNTSYHSRFGALQESLHVFIECGLQYVMQNHYDSISKEVRVFEMGLGTGLNALLTWDEAANKKQKILYHAVELYPLSEGEIMELNYPELQKNKTIEFSKIHTADWDELIIMDDCFAFIKTREDIRQFQPMQKFNVIYFDAFDPNAQPELWTESIFKKMFNMLYPNGILVTYCSKGIVRRTMQAAGFKTEKLKGPPGKKEIIRAVKPAQY